MKQLFCRLRPRIQARVFLLGVAAVTPTAAADTRFSGTWAEDRLLQAPPAFRIHFAAREKPLFMHKPPASLLLQPPAAAVTGQGAASAAPAEAPGSAPFSREQSRGFAEDLSAAPRSVPAASAGGGNPAPDIALRRFQTRLEQIRKLLETLRYLKPPHIGAGHAQYARPVIAVRHLKSSHIGAGYTRFGGVSAEDRLLQAPPTLHVHFAAREEYPPAASPHPASLLLQPLTAAVAEGEIACRHGDPLAVDGEMPTAAAAGQGAASAAPVDVQSPAPFSREQIRALAEDPLAALRSASTASVLGGNPAPDIALGRFQTRLEQIRKLLEMLRYLKPPHIGAGHAQYAHPVIAVRHLKSSHIGAGYTRFGGVSAEDRLLQAPPTLHVHFAAREVLLVESSPPASLLSKLLVAAAAEMEIDFRHGGPLAVDGETPTAAVTGQGAASAAPVDVQSPAPFSREQIRALAEDLPAALRSVPAASAGGGNPAPDIALRRFQTRLEQIRKLLETLRYLRPLHISADYTRFNRALEGSRLLQAPAALHIHFAAREEYPPAASPHPASLLLQPLTAADAEVEIDFRHGDPLAVDGAPPIAAVAERSAATVALAEAPGATPFSPKQNRAPAEDPSTALRSAPAAPAGGVSLARDTAPGRLQTRLEQIRKLLETLRYLKSPHIGAGYALFSEAPAKDRLLQTPPALRVHFAAREDPPATPPPPASLLLQPLTATGAERSAATAAPAGGVNPAPDIAPSHFHTRLRCAAADLMQSAELPLTICGVAS